MEIILASKSPRRQELIKGLELNYRVHTYDVDESFDVTLRGAEIPEYLAKKKATAYDLHLAQDEVLITADTVVWVNNKVLNKPESEAEALEMLQTICNNTHEVFTGVCIRTQHLIHVFSERTEVYCNHMSDEDLLHYIRKYKPYDKAGSYGIQDWFGYSAVEKIHGCFYNVMGLPVNRLKKELKLLQLIN
ncbi:MAG: Maf family nucleotide pyrophosphatase [Bacteroidia bacterium]